MVVFLFACCCPLWASFTFLGGASSSPGNVNSCSITLSGTNIGDLIVYAADGFIKLPDAPTDGHNSYTLIRSDITTSSSDKNSQYYTVNTTSGSLTITGTAEGGVQTYFGCGALRFSFTGLLNFNSGVATKMISTTSWDSGGATVQAGSLRIGIVNDSNEAVTVTAGSGWVMGAQSNCGCGTTFAMEYDTNAAGGSQHALATTSSNASGVMTEIFTQILGPAFQPRKHGGIF